MMLFWTLLTLALAINVPISPGETRCFRELTKLGDRFSVNIHISGGSRISIVLKAPNGGILEQSMSTKSWSYALPKTEAGYYELCSHSPSNNKPANITLFWLFQGAQNNAQLTDTMSTLNQTVSVVKHLAANQRFTQSAEASHKLLVRALSSSISFWMFVKVVAVGACVFCQITEIKKHFSKRRTAV